MTRYGDRDVELILRRAAELQYQEPGLGDDDGLSLDELQDAAAAAGIEPELVRQAAAELDRSGPLGLEASRLFGAPLRLVSERVVKGALSPAALQQLAPEVEAWGQELGWGAWTVQPGYGPSLESEVPASRLSVVGPTLHWRARTAQGARHVRVVVRDADATTVVRVEESLHGLAGGLYGGLVGGVGCGVGFGVGMGVGLGALGSPVFAVVFATTALLASYAGARGIFAAVARRRWSDLLHLQRLIQARVEALVPPHVAE